MKYKLFRFIDRLNYRWNYFCDPLHGEGTTIIMWSEPTDKEPVILLRRLRALLFGYGPGWNFGEAMVNFLFGL